MSLSSLVTWHGCPLCLGPLCTLLYQLVHQWCFGPCSVTPLLSDMERLEGNAFVLERTTNTFHLISSASVKLFFPMAFCVAVMRSTISICCGLMAKFNPLEKTSYSGWVSSLSYRLLTHLLCVLSSVELSFFCLQVNSSAFLVLLAHDRRFWNFHVCLSLLLVCWDSCVHSMNSVTFFRTALGSCVFNVCWKSSAALIKASFSNWFCASSRIILALWPSTIDPAAGCLLSVSVVCISG